MSTASGMTDPVVLWCKALRSGEYRQGRERLTTRTPDGDEDCPLGVLCKVAIKAGVPVEVSARVYGVYYDDEGGELPKSVRDWVGLRTHSGVYGGGDFSLADDNDVRGMSFGEIADLIESRPPGLFKEPKP